MLVKRVDKRLEAEAKEAEKLNSGLAMTKLTGILGQGLLEKIKTEQAELYTQLMAHIETKKQISYGFCRDVLADYNVNLDHEKRI